MPLFHSAFRVPSSAFAAFAVFISAALAFGQAADDLSVLKSAPGEPPTRKMVSAYLKTQTDAAFDARRKAVAELKTPADVKQRQEFLRAKFLEALGGFPEKTALNARTVGTIEADGYVIEKVVFESRPSHHVTANLYLPAGKGPFPAVLFPCGHSDSGKADGSYQRAAIMLVKLGIASFTYDPIGQGERKQLLDDTGKAVIKSMTGEHTAAGVGALLVGRCTATYRIWDGIRCIDYLCSRPEIDGAKLGCTGVSGGGTLTSYLMALDERILAAAPSCYITSLEKLFATIGPQDAEQNIPGQVAFGMEHADYITMRAPRPTLLLAASRDFFPIDGTWTSYREAKLLYGMLGRGEAVDLFEYDTGHGYPKAQREAMARWMLRWLVGRNEPVTEPEIAVRKTAELACTTSGQVLIEYRGKGVFELNVEEAGRLREMRRRTMTADGIRGRASTLIDWEAVGGLRPALVAGDLPDPGTRGTFVNGGRDGVRVPGVIFMPKKASAKPPLVLYLHGDGKHVDAGADGPIEAIVKSGKCVFAIDPRGMGETAAAVTKPGAAPMFGVGYNDTFIALHLGRPLLGQRVQDVLAVHELMRGQFDPDAIEIVGVGAAAPIALHVAAVDNRIKAVTLHGGLISFESVVRTPTAPNQLPHVVPGVLRFYDLPELAAAIAPRALTIRSPVDASGRLVNQDALDAEYAICRDAYRKAGAENKLVLRAGP
jgi:cephalosporin-C deacetylase-like acetyl esterase